VPAEAGDEVLVCDLSMQRNQAACCGCSTLACRCATVDHHKVDPVPQHAGCRPASTSTPGVHQLADRPPAAGAFARLERGRRLRRQPRVADTLAAEMGLGEPERQQLRLLGEGINYNAYGDDASDQHIAPQPLYARLAQHAHPLELLRHDSIGSELDALRQADLQQALAQPVHAAGSGAHWVSCRCRWSARHRQLANSWREARSSPCRAQGRPRASVVSPRAPQAARGS
jgi:hypothetical protein